MGVMKDSKIDSCLDMSVNTLKSTEWYTFEMVNYISVEFSFFFNNRGIGKDHMYFKEIKKKESLLC